MSALAGPGDLAGSLGEMATEQCHLLSVWAAGMLAGVSLGLETQPLPRLSHWLGDAISRLDHRLHSQDLLFSYCPPPTQKPMEKGCPQGVPSFFRKHVESRPHHGPEAPGLDVSWSSVCVCDQDPGGSRWVNVTLW